MKAIGVERRRVVSGRPGGGGDGAVGCGVRIGVGREIGELLSISPKSVGTYRQRLMEKLRLESRAELVQYALRNGLLES